MRENRYQSELRKKIEARLPFCITLKNDTGYRQGLPDLLILQGPRWAALEVKRSAKEPLQPNQEYYVDLMDAMSFAAFVYPENEEGVLSQLFDFFES